jgi:hypothetical protein
LPASLTFPAYFSGKFQHMLTLYPFPSPYPIKSLPD